MKTYRYDVIAFLVALVVMLGVFFILPTHLGILLRGVVGFSLAIIVFVAYLIIRKPDTLIELEELLRETAETASEIAEIGSALDDTPKTRGNIMDIASTIAHVATKGLARNLKTIDVHVRRLARVTRSFRVVLQVLTGETRLRGAAAAQEITEIETKKIPGVRRALEDIEVAIDEVQAKQYQTAENDLATLTQLADLSTRAQEAVEILKKIVRDNPK